MANINLPVQGEEPWDSKLNAAVAAVNAEAEQTTAILTTGRLSGENIDNAISSAVSPKANAADVYSKTDADARYATTSQGAKADSSVQKNLSTLQKIGDGPDPNASTTQNVKLLITANRINPDKIIEQHFVGYSFYSGTPAAGTGTLQGGSSESYAYANGTTGMPTVLGFEGVGRGDGDNAARTIQAVIGNQGTALASGVAQVSLLVSLRARGPKSDSTGVVADARSLDIQEPLTGTQRYTLFGIGRHYFKKGAHANVLEISTAAGVSRWTTDGIITRWYASDSTSTRVSVDGGDTPSLSARIVSNLFAGSGKHLSFTNDGTEVFSVAATGLLGLSGTTVTSATGGSATALPGQPVGYLTVAWNGTNRRIPFYAV